MGGIVGGGVSSLFALPLVGIAPTLLGRMPWRQRYRFLARHNVTTHGAGLLVCRMIARLRMKLSFVWLVVLLIVAWRGGGLVPQPDQEFPSINPTECSGDPVLGFEIFEDPVILCRLAGSTPSDLSVVIGAICDDLREGREGHLVSVVCLLVYSTGSGEQIGVI